MKNSILILLLLVFSHYITAQEVEINNVQKRYFKGVKPIMNQKTNEPAGYYTYYLEEKVDKDEFRFSLRIFDLDLNLRKEAPIIMPKKTTLDGSTFNGSDFLFVFRNLRDKLTTFMTFDYMGNEIKKLEVPDSKRYLPTADVFPAEDGFFVVKSIKEKKIGYAVVKYDRELNEKWESKFVPEKGYAGVEAVETSGDQIIIVQTVGKSRLSKNLIGEIVCLDNLSGDVKYNYSLYDGEATCIPSSFLIDKDQNVVTGGMYFDGEKWSAKNSDGIFFLKLSPKGEKMFYSKESWDNGIQKIIKQGSDVRFAIGSKPKVLFEDIIQAKDGSYQIISETFRKSLQMINIKVKDLITGRYIGDIGYHNNRDHGNAMNFEILDFIIFNFSTDGNLANLNIIEKPHTNITCYTPYNGYGGLNLARAVREMGWFNYGFMHQLNDSENRIMVSSNFVIGEPYIGLTTIEKDKVSETTKIMLDRKSSKGGSLGVAPAKPGKLFTYLFDKSEKTVYMKIIDMQP